MNLLTHTTSRFIPSSILIFALILSGCGGGGDSKSTNPPPTSTASSVSSALVASSSSSTVVSSSTSSTPVSSRSSSSSLGGSTTYKVSVHVPESFPGNDGSTKKTNIQLNANNFALVSVSLSGVVIERYAIKPTDIAKTNDGDWTITAPGTPRVDTVIVADVTKAIDLPATNTIKTEGLVYAPTTAEVVDIDVGSTSAYKNLIAELGGSGTFASQGVEPADSKNIAAVESLVNSVQMIAAEEDLSGKTTVSAALAVVDEPVKAAVKQEVINIKNHVVGTAASLIRDEGGLFWYNTEEEDIMRGALIGMATVTEERYEANKFVAKPLKGIEEVIVLSPAGWVPSMDSLKVVAYNDDGSVTTQDTAWDSVGGTLSVKQAFDLSGRNIVEFLQSTTNTSGMTSIVNPAAVFASGAKGYRGNTVEQRPIYNTYFVPADANGKCWGGENLASSSGGNCMSMDMYSGETRTHEPAVSGYNKLFSPDVAINTKDYRAIVVGTVGPNSLEVQIVNDANKTVKFYENSSGVFNRLIATGTWSEITLPYLTSDNKAIHFTYPQSVFAAADVWGGEWNSEFYITQQNGYLRPIYTLNEESNDESVFFNATANTSITNAAAGYTNPLVGNWKLGDDYFIFSNNNTFTQVKAATDDPDCVAGSATGTYSWNPLTSMVKVELQADNTAVEQGDSCAFGGKVKLTLTANTMSFTEDGELITLTKTTSTTGLVGTWVFGTASDYAILFFTDTQYFLSDYNDEDGYGTESGTYTFNAGTGQLTATVLRDDNGNEGFSNGGSVPLVIAGDNQSFTAGGGNLFKRLK
jgi:hypothetical protein